MKWLKLLGVTFEDDVFSLVLQADYLLSKVESRIYTFLEFVKDMDIRKALSYLFDSIILSLFMSGIEIWNSSMQTKYLDLLIRFSRERMALENER